MNFGKNYLQKGVKIAPFCNLAYMYINVRPSLNDRYEVALSFDKLLAMFL